MNKGFSRAQRDFDHDARQTARAAARRAGKSLGEWLDEAIRDKADDAEIDDDFADEDDGRLEAVARRLSRARRTEPRRWGDDLDGQEPQHRRGRRGGRSRHDHDNNPRDFDPRAIADDAAAAVERRLAESERQTARALDNLAGLIKRVERDRRSSEDNEGVARAIAALAQRTQESERQTARALGDIAGILEGGRRAGAESDPGYVALAERLGRIESRLTEQPSGGASGVRPIRSALARLEARLDRLAGDDRSVDVEHALTGLDRRLTDIARRLDDSREAPAARIGAGAASPAALDRGLRQADPRARRPLADAIAEITQRQRMLDGDTPAAPPPPADPTPQLAALQGAIASISRQLESAHEESGERAEQQMVAMRQVESLRREVEDMSRAVSDLAPRASVMAVETALRDLSHRVESQRKRGVADDLLAPAERIAGELRAVIKDLDLSPVVRNLHADVATIGRRLDAMQGPDAIDVGVVRDLAAQTREMRELLTTLAARPLPVEKLETRVLDLTQRVDSLALAGGASARDMGEVVKAIRSIVTTETGKGFEAFNRRLEELAGKLDEAVARSGAKRFDELGERIDRLGKSLAQRIDRSAQPVDTAPLEQLVAKLAKKIDSALDSKGHAPGFEEIGRKIERLETRFTDAAPERQFSDLAQRIDLVHKTLATRLEQGVGAREAADVDAIESLMRGLDQKIESALASDSGRVDLSAIERQLSQLSLKIDRLDDPSANPRLGALLARPPSNPQLDAISDRLEQVQAALTARAETDSHAQSQKADLSALVEQLTVRLNESLAPNADNAALKLLERQIGELSRRLDRSDENGSALAAIEARIGALVTRVEDTNAIATQAAEEAVRRATRDMLREATSAEPGALGASVERELTDLRLKQDETGQRTHDTLAAVHETLEHVVDRLAIFEDELSEIRGAPVDLDVVAERAAAASPPELAVEPRRARIDDADDDLMDFLLPPGGATAKRRAAAADVTPESEAESRGARSVQSDFIAAARRAAQQAALDADAAEAQSSRRKAERRGAAAPARAVGGAVKVGSAIGDRKRPLLLGLGALVLLVGAYQVARVGIEGGAPTEVVAPHVHGDVDAPAKAEPSAAAKADAKADVKGEPKSDAKSDAPAAGEAPAKPGAPAKPLSAPPRMLLPPSGGADAGPAAPRSADPSASVKPVGSPSAGLDSTPVGAIAPTAAPAALSPQEASAPIRTLAERGDSAAQFDMGARYAEGRGVPRDPKLSAEWFEKAATQGLAPAQYRLGSIYEKGVGVERSYTQAREWYRRAAEAGNARSMHNLAVLLAEGGDAKPDYAAAAEWFQKAAEHGVRDSQYNLAILFARGLGVPQSLPRSYQWFAAAEQGDEDAGKKRDEVAARLDSKELAAAKALTAAFQPKAPAKAANEPPAPRGVWEAEKQPLAKEPNARPPVKSSARPKVSQI